MKKENKTMIPTPAELREKYELEDQPLITFDWEADLAERRRFGLDRSPIRKHEYGEYLLMKSLRQNYYKRLKDRQRKLEMKISEDYWSAKPPMSPIQGKDFGFIFKN